MCIRDRYGIVRTYESWLLIAYTVMSLCLWRSVDVAKNDFEEDYNGYVSSVHTLSYIAIAFFFGICMIFKTQVQDFCQMDDLMFYSCFLYVFTYTSMLYVQRRDKQVLKYKFSTMATLLTIVPGTFLSIWLIYRGRVQGPVSYTHLDVYKRQGTDKRREDSKADNGSGGRFFYRHKQGGAFRRTYL